MLKALESGLITGPPDTLNRGRIVGDYRRVALYGIDTLLEAKRLDQARVGKRLEYDAGTVRLLEELVAQVRRRRESYLLRLVYTYNTVRRLEELVSQARLVL
jgi:formate C-acetyltransferase